MTASMFAAPARERIVVITSSYPAYAGDPSGHFVQAEVAELRAAGHELIVVAARSQGRRRDAQREDGVRWIAAGDAFGWPGVTARLRERPQRAGGIARFVYGALRELDAIGAVDRAIAHFLLPSAFPALAWSRLRARHVEVVAHGSDARLFARLPGLVRRHIARSLTRRKASLRCTSHELARLLAHALGSSFRGRIEVAPSPISVSGTPSRARARELLRIGANTPLVVVVARLIASKRVDVALRAAALVPSAQVVVIGDGPLRSALASSFPGVTFTGPLERDRTLSYIAAADVVLSASLLEGSPTVLREARLLGTPIVALRAGDLPERYRDDPNAIVITPPAP
jgi:glycosyltransferase involved in cell wall biosynthesis